MQAFQTKDKLVSAWVKDRAHELPGRYEENIPLAKIESTMTIKYTPHLYRGGYVIRGFGFSTERIGKYIAPENAGDPELV